MLTLNHLPADITTLILDTLDLKSLDTISQINRDFNFFAKHNLFKKRTSQAITQQKKWLQKIIQLQQIATTPLSTDAMWEWLQRTVLTEEDVINGLLFIATKNHTELPIANKVFSMLLKQLRDIYDELDNLNEFCTVLSTLKIITPVLKSRQVQKILVTIDEQFDASCKHCQSVALEALAVIAPILPYGSIAHILPEIHGRINSPNLRVSRAAMRVLRASMPSLKYSQVIKLFPCLIEQFYREELLEDALAALRPCVAILQYNDIHAQLLELKKQLRGSNRRYSSKVAVLYLLAAFAPALKEEDLQSVLPDMQAILLKATLPGYGNPIIFAAAIYAFETFATYLNCDFRLLLPIVTNLDTNTLSEVKLSSLKGISLGRTQEDITAQFTAIITQLNTDLLIGFPVKMAKLSAFIPVISYENRQKLFNEVLEQLDKEDLYFFNPALDALQTLAPFLKYEDIQTILPQIERQLESRCLYTLRAVFSLFKVFSPFLEKNKRFLPKLVNLLNDNAANNVENYKMALDILEFFAKTARQEYVTLLLTQLDHKNEWVFPLIITKLIWEKPLINAELGRLIFEKISQCPQFFSKIDYFINFIVFAKNFTPKLNVGNELGPLNHLLIFEIIIPWLEEIRQSSLPKGLRDFYQQLKSINLIYQDSAKKEHFTASLIKILYSKLKENADLFAVNPTSENYSLFKDSSYKAIDNTCYEFEQHRYRKRNFLHQFVRAKSSLFFKRPDPVKMFNELRATIELVGEPNPPQLKSLS